MHPVNTGLECHCPRKRGKLGLSIHWKVDRSIRQLPKQTSGELPLFLLSGAYSQRFLSPWAPSSSNSDRAARTPPPLPPHDHHHPCSPIRPKEQQLHWGVTPPELCLTQKAAHVDCEKPPRYSADDLTSQPQSEQFPPLERHLTCSQFSGGTWENREAEEAKTGRCPHQPNQQICFQRQTSSNHLTCNYHPVITMTTAPTAALKWLTEHSEFPQTFVFFFFKKSLRSSSRFNDASELLNGTEIVRCGKCLLMMSRWGKTRDTSEDAAASRSSVFIRFQSFLSSESNMFWWIIYSRLGKYSSFIKLLGDLIGLREWGSGGVKKNERDETGRVCIWVSLRFKFEVGCFVLEFWNGRVPPP